MGTREKEENTFDRDRSILLEFLNTPLDSPDDLFMRFSEIPGAVLREGDVQNHQRFVYGKGARNNKVLMVAHADTYWDSRYFLGNEGNRVTQDLYEENGAIYNRNGGLGADNRAGCAMLWLLRESGHSLLLVDGEEHGQRGANWLMEENGDIAGEIQNEHSFAIEFDRRNATDFKCYYVGTDEFRSYLNARTHYTEPDRHSTTDISHLCRRICGVNLSVGYRNEHTPQEHIFVQEWFDTLNLCREWLAEPELPSFPLFR